MASRDFALVRPPRLASRSCVSRAGKRGGARGREGEPERRSLLFSAAGVGVGGDDDLFSPGREKKTSPTKNKAGRRRDVFVPGQDPRSRRGLVFFLCFRLLSFKGRERKAKGGGGRECPPKKKIKKSKNNQTKDAELFSRGFAVADGGPGAVARATLAAAVGSARGTLVAFAEGTPLVVAAASSPSPVTFVTPTATAATAAAAAPEVAGAPAPAPARFGAGADPSPPAPAPEEAVESSEGPGAGAVSLGEEEEGEEDGAWIKRWWWLRVWGMGRGGSATSRGRRDEQKKKKKRRTDEDEETNGRRRRDERKKKKRRTEEEEARGE